MTRWRVGLLAIALAAPPAVRLAAQSPSVSTAGGALHLRAPAFHFINGDALDRLKDGRSVRFDFELTVLAKPDGPAAVHARQSFNVSYDLWEERFAVVRIGMPSASISHLTATDAEAWCLEQLAVPVSALGRLGRDAGFWIRLEYRVPDGARATAPDAGERFTLRSLIDALSRRRSVDQLGDSVEAGPFRLPD